MHSNYGENMENMIRHFLKEGCSPEFLIKEARYDRELVYKIFHEESARALHAVMSTVPRECSRCKTKRYYYPHVNFCYRCGWILQ